MRNRPFLFDMECVLWYSLEPNEPQNISGQSDPFLVYVASVLALAPMFTTKHTITTALLPLMAKWPLSSWR